MKMTSKHIYFFFLVTTIYVSHVYGSCGNWQAYRDEKCIKIFDTEKTITFEDAIKSCSQLDNSSELITIHSKEEQDFISEYLFKTHKLVDNVWIGLRNKSESFEWIDFSNKQYTNWRTGNPTNKLEFNCVQLESDSLQWANEPCNRKGLVVCQKMPDITLPELLKQMIEVKVRLKKTEEDLKETKADFKVTRNERNGIFNIVFNKNVSHYQLFTDLNGKNKAFIIPLSVMKKGYTFDDSVNLCKIFNSTLIEIQSLEKQIILESFLGRLGFQSDLFKYFWINGERDSSGKWKWSGSGTQFTFTNWHSDRPTATADHNYLVVDTYSIDTFGKWYNEPKTYSSYVVCEHTFGF